MFEVMSRNTTCHVLNYQCCKSCVTGNHKGIFKASGFSSIKEYRYWDSKNLGLDLNGMLEDLNVSVDICITRYNVST